MASQARRREHFLRPPARHSGSGAAFHEAWRTDRLLHLLARKRGESERDPVPPPARRNSPPPARPRPWGWLLRSRDNIGLSANMVEILPSILAADFARLGEAIAPLEAAGCRMLHVDVMDGHFVPNFTLGPPVVASLRKVTKMTLDVHLMISDPDRYAPLFIEAGADQVLVHQEACVHLDRTLRMIQSEGARAGVAINPAIPVATLDEVLDIVDYVLVMSVNPGFGGQKFIPGALHKIRRLAELRRQRGLSYRMEVDGGVGLDTVADVVRAGAEILVAGNAVFGNGDPTENAQALLKAATEAVLLKV